MNSEHSASEKTSLSFRPQIYNPKSQEDEPVIKRLLDDASVQVFDQFDHQSKELDRILALENGARRSDAGERSAVPGDCWVYYPWNRAMVHLLAEPDFVRVRTNRNRDKITAGEQNALATKRIGVIGMSVGRSVATTMALERIFGHLKIADFDTLDLSNLNRIKAPLIDLGLPKTVSVAREIAGMDPFLSIETYDEGATADNMAAFLLDGGKLDLLIDECDSLDVKLICRKFARKHGIPVVMETSDRGMIDIERFDLEPDRPLFHGYVKDSEWENQPWTPELKAALLMKIVDFEKLSEKARVSLGLIGKTLLRWPQLASAVVLGGGTVTNTARRIMLGDKITSGRYYVDMDNLIGL